MHSSGNARVCTAMKLPKRPCMRCEARMPPWKAEPDVESFNFFIERPELPQADILIEHVGGHHHTDKAKLFHRAARFLDRGGDVLQRHQRDPFETLGIGAAEFRKPIVVGVRDIHCQIHLARRAERNAAGWINHLDIDPVDVHVGKLNARIFVGFAQGLAKIAVPGIARPKRAPAIFLLQIFL